MTEDWLDDIPYEPERPKNHVEPEHHETLTTLANYLLQPKVLEWLRHSDLALSFHDEVKVAVERVRLAIDRPQDREIDVPIGPCLDCGGAIIARLPPEGQGEVVVRCEGDCGQTWAAAQYRKLGRFIEPNVETRPLFVSVSMAAGLLGVTTRTVRRMVAKGVIREERFGPRKCRLREDDVKRLASERTST